MIRIQQLKLEIGHSKEDLSKKAAKLLKIDVKQIKQVKIVKRSIDARKKPELLYVYTIDVLIDQEKKILKKVNNNNVMLSEPVVYTIPSKVTRKNNLSPIVVGSGPAGLFCAYLLAVAGLHPIILERGKNVNQRKRDVDLFWQTNQLDTNSNVQFGEGGAGTFSDGKLNTLVKDTCGRSQFVLETFVSCGAPEPILYENKPHIGTDVLLSVIENLRNKIISYGGRFCFEHCVTSLDEKDDRIIVTEKSNDGLEFLETNEVILAIGHSARDTFEMLWKKGFYMEAKSFAMGFRVEHPQSMIDYEMYGDHSYNLPASPYKVTANFPNQRGVYSFCMCPGGYVVNASSELGRLAVNGMSYNKRDSKNANSAIIVSVTPNDFGYEGPLSGVYFQRDIEKKAYDLGSGKIPQQLLGDFIQKQKSIGYGDFESETKGASSFAPLHELFSKEITDTFLLGMEQFGRRIPGFDRKDCILSGVESRTSSPVKIPRNDEMICNKKGCYPCGEGAGYAGGIMSAAMDGMKVAEKIIEKYIR